MAPLPVRKWRPQLSLIVAAVLAVVMALPLIVLTFVLPQASVTALSAQSFVPAATTIAITTAIVGYVFVRALTGPVRELTARTARLSIGDRGAIAPLRQHGSREIADLSRGLFGMADALFERSDYISNFATHISHEIKTPLTSIRGAVELILDQGDDMAKADRQRFLENILDDTWRITSLLERLRELAHADNPKVRGETRMNDVIASLCGRSDHAPTIALTGDEETPFPMSQENAVIVFSNLIDNAVQHGADHVRIHVSDAPSGRVFEIADNGSGVSQDNEARVFDLFFTTRRDLGGTGLGLAIVQSMLHAHGGQISLVRRADAGDEGSAFLITFRPSG